MRKIVIDTNIIFSCLLNADGTIGDLVFNSVDIFEFYSSQYMRYEIRKHWNKLMKISKLSNLQLETSYEKVLQNITFINEELIPEKEWLKAEQLAEKIDLNDTDFIALTKYLKATLWTGDKVLYAGLKSIGFRSVMATSDLLRLRNRLSKF